MNRISLLLQLLTLFLSVDAQTSSGLKYPKKRIKDLSAYRIQIQNGDSSCILNYADLFYSMDKMDSAFFYYDLAYKTQRELSLVQKKKYSNSGVQRTGKSPLLNINNKYILTNQWEYRVYPVSFNTPQEDLMPFYKDGKILFSSSRLESNKMKGPIYELTGLPYLKFYLADTMGKFYPISGLPKRIGSDLHEGPLVVSKDSTILVTTKNRSSLNAKGEQLLYLEFYYRVNQIWSEPQEFIFNSTEYSTQHPCFDSSGDYLYFSSNMPNGLGGFDLYRVKWLKSGWGNLELLNSDINSAYDEVFPSIGPNNSLYYVTNDADNYGGLDIVEFKDGKRRLLPEPINSVYDDFGITWSDSIKGYYTTNRSGEKFNDDLYTFIRKPKEIPMAFRLEVVKHSDISTTKQDTIHLVARNSISGDSTVVDLMGGIVDLGSFLKPYPLWNVSIKCNGYYDIHDEASFDTVNGIMTAKFRLTEIKPVLSTSGFLTVFFQNGEPGKEMDLRDSLRDYSNYYRGYLKGKHVYYAKSSSSHPELDSLFVDIERGMRELELFPFRLDSTLRAGRKIKVYMGVYTSPIGYEKSNKELALKRGAVLKNYIVNWNQGALKKYIDNGQLIVSDEYFPLFERKRRKVKTKGTGPSVTMFGVPASRNRRVNVVWETLADK